MTFTTVLFIYFFILTAGLSHLTGRLIEKYILRESLNPLLTTIAGFSLVPAILSWIGFSGLGKITYFFESMGVLVCFYTLLQAIHHRQIIGYWIANNFIILIPIMFSGSLLLFSKSCYFDGAINNMDDLRSVALTGSLATNSLKPAFVTDFSIPLSYSYYLYEWTAWLYSTVRGIGMPSIPVVTINLYVIFFFYAGLYLIGKSLFQKFGTTHFLLLSAILTFYGFDFLYPEAWQQKHLEWWNHKQITQMASYFQWTYQYLFSAIICLVAFLHLILFLDKDNKSNGLLFILLHASAAGFGTITFVWSTISIIFTLPFLLWKHHSRNTWSSILRLLPISLLLTTFILLPILPAFIGREVIVSFNAHPSWWFSKTTHDIDSFLSHFIILFHEIGPLLFAGMLSILLFGKYLSQTKGKALIFLSIYGIAVFLLSLFSQSSYFDWFSRGVLLMVILSALYASGIILKLLETHSKYAWIFMITVLLLPQAYNFLLENYFRNQQCRFDQTSEIAKQINQKFPLGTIFHIAKDEALAKALLYSGRGITASPQFNYLTTYKNTKEFLTEKLDWDFSDKACRSSKFGKTVLVGKYFDIRGTLVKATICESE